MKIRDFGFLLLGGLVTAGLLLFIWGQAPGQTENNGEDQVGTSLSEDQSLVSSSSNPTKQRSMSELLCSEDFQLGLSRESVLSLCTGDPASDLFEVSMLRTQTTALIALPQAPKLTESGAGTHNPGRYPKQSNQSSSLAEISPQLYLFKADNLVAALEEGWLDSQDYEALIEVLSRVFGERSSFPPRQARIQAEELEYFGDATAEGVPDTELYLNREDVVARNAWKHLAPKSHFWYNKESGSTIFVLPLDQTRGDSRQLNHVLVGMFNNSGLTCVADCYSAYELTWSDYLGHAIFRRPPLRVTEKKPAR